MVTTKKALDAVKTLIQWIGDNSSRKDLHETPTRFLKAYQELFYGYKKELFPKIKLFNFTGNSKSLIFDSGEFYSFCEHHILPFWGKYYISYEIGSSKKIIGLSKISRIVSYSAAKLQTQEELTNEIANSLMNIAQFKPKGVAVLLCARHSCKSWRGVKSKGIMITSCFKGSFDESRKLKQDFFEMVKIEDAYNQRNPN